MYLVTGGYTGFSSLSSTEVLVQGAAQWMEVGSLPVATQGLRAVSFNNKILVAGEIMLQLQRKYHFVSGGWANYTQDSILQFDNLFMEWFQVGQLQAARSYHGLGVVNVKDIQDYCQ